MSICMQTVRSFSLLICFMWAGTQFPCCPWRGAGQNAQQKTASQGVERFDNRNQNLGQVEIDQVTTAIANYTSESEHLRSEIQQLQQLLIIYVQEELRWAQPVSLVKPSVPMPTAPESQRACPQAAPPHMLNQIESQKNEEEFDV